MILPTRHSFARILFRFYTSATLHDPSHQLNHLLQIAVTHHSHKITRQSHTLILSLGLHQDPFFATKLISAYAVCSDTIRSRLVFDAIRRKNVYLWNSLINGYAKNYKHFEAFDLFSRMCGGEELPDEFTISTVLKLSGELRDEVAGKSIHGKSIRTGYVLDTVVSNSIMSMYTKCRKLVELHKVFDEMPQRNSSSWNVLIAAYTVPEGCNLDGCVWKIYREMQIEGIEPSSFTVSSLLPLCSGNTGICDYGRELHCYILKHELDSGLGSDVHLGSCLIDMYSRNGKVFMGRRVFDRMKFRNIFAWTAMVNGYVQNGDSDEALILFREMQIMEKIEPNRVSLVTVLPACSSFSGLMGGKQIHGFSIRKEISYDIALCNALIDTYSKCGSLDYARCVFDNGSFCKDEISWSSVISGYGLHGKGEEAIHLYESMLKLGIKPDKVNVVAVLSACARSGLVNEGLNIYNSVIDDYQMKPTLEICACVVDMLGKSGQLQQALDFIKKMPVDAGPSVWGALVSASEIHGNFDMRDLAYRFLVQMEPTNPSNYVSLSNLYASSRRWDGVAEVRTLMKEKGLRKMPGCSWISINSINHCFYVADKAHPSATSIYEMLHSLVMTMKGAGYSLKSEASA